MSRHALLAVAAEYRQAADDVIAGLHVGHLFADFLDDAGGLVAEHGGRGVRIEAVDEMEVAAAYAAGDGFFQDFAGLGVFEVYILHAEQPIWPRENGRLP